MVDFERYETGLGEYTVDALRLAEALQRYYDGDGSPQTTNEIGVELLRLAAGLLNRRSFRGYTDTWREDMMSHATATMWAAVADPNKPADTANPKALFNYLYTVGKNSAVKVLQQRNQRTADYDLYKVWAVDKGIAAIADAGTTEIDSNGADQGEASYMVADTDCHDYGVADARWGHD